MFGGFNRSCWGGFASSHRQHLLRRGKAPGMFDILDILETDIETPSGQANLRGRRGDQEIQAEAVEIILEISNPVQDVTEGSKQCRFKLEG